jgi:hypothetical protein
MLLLHFERAKMAKLLFLGTLLLALYWLSFHATSPLDLQF